MGRGRELSGELSARMGRDANAAVAEAYELEKAIAQEIRLLSAESTEAARRAKRFGDTARELTTALKRLGDLENWAAALEAAAIDVAEAARSTGAAGAVQGTEDSTQETDGAVLKTPEVSQLRVE